MSGVSGSQFGDNNTQYNWLQERRLDATRVERLNAHSAADYVAELNAGDAAFVLATASADASARVLRVLIANRQVFAMAVLTHMDQDKARELVTAIGPSAASLARVSEAAEAIADLEDVDTGNPELGKRCGPLALAPASKRTQGFCQDFVNGQVYWSEHAGPQATRGAISEYYKGMGGSGSRLGFPLTQDLPAERSPFGTSGSYQRFEFVRSYRPSTCEKIGTECGATVYWCEQYGAHATWGGIGEHYEQHRSTAGPLGFPIDEERKVGPSPRESGPGTVGWCQRFEGGVIYYSEKTRAVSVPPAIAALHDQHGGVTGGLGFPVSAELPAAQSPFGTPGRLQRFETTNDLPEDIRAAWTGFTRPAGATVYVSGAHGVHCVEWGNGNVYEKMGGPASWLGYPRSDEDDARSSAAEPRRTIQQFEGGAIYYAEGHGSVPVPLATMEFITRHDGLRERFGFPVKAEVLLAGESTARDNPGMPDPAADREQFFEHGIVTVRNGVMEAWLRIPA